MKRRPAPRVINVAVEARFELAGAIVPVRYAVAGQEHLITSVGRSWRVAGEGWHFLVMDEQGRVRELLLRLPALRWQLLPGPEDDLSYC